MKSVLHLLDELPLIYLLIPALLLGMAPWPVQPEPHLLEKLHMLVAGALTRPIDTFDLLMHAAPAMLVVIKVGRDLWLRSRA
ncbi:MAG: hypothetical protein WBG92_04450 [Thiohalocapsa sp.]